MDTAQKTMNLTRHEGDISVTMENTPLDKEYVTAEVLTSKQQLTFGFRLRKENAGEGDFYPLSENEVKVPNEVFERRFGGLPEPGRYEVKLDENQKVMVSLAEGPIDV